MFKRYIQRHPVRSQRFLEIVPGLFSWFLILFPIWGSVIIPNLVAYYIITFNIYWLYRSFTMGILAFIAHFRIKASMAHNWLTEIESLPHYQQVRHIVIIPTYKEPLSTLERTLNELAKQTFPLQRLAIVLSFEVREGEAAQQKAKQLTQKYAHTFGYFFTTFHPDIVGEIKGKSSNTCWGAKYAKKILVDEHRLPLEYLTITSEDADALFDPQYFSALTYHFLTSTHPYERIFQGSIMFYNNIWQVPAPVRVLASTFSVYELYMLMRPDYLINFSTYSTSLKLIVDIGYWDTNVIPEDYRLFFKAFFKTQGKVKVEPIFLPINADAAESNTFWSTMFNQYEQIKRWAWGVSDDAYIIKQWILSSDIPFMEKTLKVIHVLESHFLWPVNWFAITIGALIPPLINPVFSKTIMGKTLPQVSSGILTISLINLLFIIVIDWINRPKLDKKTQKHSVLRRLISPLEFVLLPVVGFFFSALPGLDAHTRLLMGKYIEYRVTEKV